MHRRTGLSLKWVWRDIKIKNTNLKTIVFVFFFCDRHGDIWRNGQESSKVPICILKTHHTQDNQPLTHSHEQQNSVDGSLGHYADIFLDRAIGSETLRNEIVLFQYYRHYTSWTCNKQQIPQTDCMLSDCTVQEKQESLQYQEVDFPWRKEYKTDGL